MPCIINEPIMMEEAKNARTRSNVIIWIASI